MPSCNMIFVGKPKFEQNSSLCLVSVSLSQKSVTRWNFKLFSFNRAAFEQNPTFRSTKRLLWEFWFRKSLKRLFFLKIFWCNTGFSKNVFWQKWCHRVRDAKYPRYTVEKIIKIGVMLLWICALEGRFPSQPSNGTVHCLVLYLTFGLHFELRVCWGSVHETEYFLRAPRWHTFVLGLYCVCVAKTTHLGVHYSLFMCLSFWNCLSQKFTEHHKKISMAQPGVGFCSK